MTLFFAIALTLPLVLVLALCWPKGIAWKAVCAVLYSAWAALGWYSDDWRRMRERQRHDAFWELFRRTFPATAAGNPEALALRKQVRVHINQ